ncbi:unnamed protein product [Soboliphyme baturini]|uniref:Adipokinetic hormone 1 n=1 Tax=Soboliphyme baturini TaxID=241478 RepID=A0A183IN03_9BILA|nr:unnamed protein product [Soboliphyme baturini]
MSPIAVPALKFVLVFAILVSQGFCQLTFSQGWGKRKDPRMNEAASCVAFYRTSLSTMYSYFLSTYTKYRECLQDIEDVEKYEFR